jgi:hypothetical protein
VEHDLIGLEQQIIRRHLMNAKKIIGILITALMIVTANCSAVMADDAEEGKSCSTSSGITITLPSGFEGWWTGMDDNDPGLRKHGLKKSDIDFTYKAVGMSLSAADGDADASYRETYEWFYVAVFETGAPSATSSGINAVFADRSQWNTFVWDLLSDFWRGNRS